MRLVWTAAAAATLLAAFPIEAKQTSRPITDTDPNAVDIAKTPVTDLNLDKTDIPPILQAAISKPYALDGIRTCSQITAAVEQLDTVLGPDVDIPPDARGGVSAGRVAKWAVGSFIPFRGLIREISGANAHDRAIEAAARAGFSRRAFLKGLGHSKGCKYPASPATPAIIKARELALKEQQAAKEKAEAAKKGDESTASTPDSDQSS